MPIGAAIPTVVSAQIVRHLDAEAVYAARTNRSYERDAAVGDTINILPPGAVTVGSYDPAANTAISYASYAPGNAIAVQLNSRSHFAITVDDIHAQQSVPNVLANGAQVAASELVTTLDAHVRDKFLSVSARNRNIGAASSDTAGEVNFGAAITDAIKLSVANTLSAAKRRMIAASVPGEHWAIIGPAGWALLTAIYSQPSVAGDRISEEVSRNGFIGNLYGMNIYVSPNAKVNAVVASTSKANERWVFGNDYALAFVVSLSKTERIRLESRFADAIRGLAVYGSAVIESAGVFTATLHYRGLPDFA